MSTLKIFSAYHLDAPRPSTTYFEPVHVGKKSSNLTLYGMTTDSTYMDNISDKNRFYSELTMQYHIWKSETKHLDFVGMCHYRRLFNPLGTAIIQPCDLSFEYGKTSRPQTTFNQTTFDAVTSSYAQELIQQKLQCCDIITLTAFNKTNKWPLLSMVELGWISAKALTIFFEVCQSKMTNQDFTRFIEVMNFQNDHYCNNMLITSSELFNQYSAWLFDILFDFENAMIDEEHRTNTTIINPRMIGYFSEYMLKPWIILNNLHAEQMDSICFSNMKTDSRI